MISFGTDFLDFSLAYFGDDCGDRDYEALETVDQSLFVSLYSHCPVKVKHIEDDLFVKIASELIMVNFIQVITLASD